MNFEHIRWGIIGCGNVTEVKSGPGFQKATRSSLQTVMRRNTEAAKDYAQRHNVPRWVDQAEDLIHDPKVDAVYIATPPASHGDLAILVAEAGKPCYVEKPMGTSMQECRRMIDAFESARSPLFVAYYRRALQPFVKIKELVTDQSLGRLQKIEYTYRSSAMLDPSSLKGWRFNKHLSGGGLLWDLGSHALDLFDFWAGPLKEIKGQRICEVPAQGIEHTVQCSAICDTEVRVSATWDFAHKDSIDAVRLIFEDGEVCCSVFGSSTLDIKNVSGEDLSECFEPQKHVQQPLIQNVVETLCGSAEAVSTGRTALRTNQVIEALPLVKG